MMFGSPNTLYLRVSSFDLIIFELLIFVMDACTNILREL